MKNFVSRAAELPASEMNTHHDRNRGQSPLRHPGCIHCAQPVPVSLCSDRLQFRGCVRRTYVVERAELGGGLVQASIGREDRAATLSLVANNPTHGDVVVRCRFVVWERS